MSKRRILVPILLVVAVLLGFAAVTLTSRPKADKGQKEVAGEKYSGSRSPAGQESTSEATKPESSSTEAENKDGNSTGLPSTGIDAPRQGRQDAPAQREQVPRPRVELDRQGPPHPTSTMQLIRLTRGIARLEGNESHRLNAKQAGQILETLIPLRSKPKLTEGEAEKTLNALKRVLTADQLNLIAQMRPGRPFGARPDRTDGGNPPPPQGTDGARSATPGGPPPPPPGVTGNQPRFDPNSLRDFNPFYSKPATEGPFEQERVKRMDDFFEMLAERAKN